MLKIRNWYPDMDCVDITSKDCHIIVSRDEDGAVYIKIRDLDGTVEREIVLGESDSEDDNEALATV